MKYLDIKLSALDSKGKETIISLADFKNKNVVLYFYPKDDTPICTVEAVDFRDKFKEFPKETVIIGVSPDGIKSHKKFFEKHHLNFYLASDTEYKLAKAFDNVGEKSLDKDINLVRSTFILNKDGKIVKEMRNININGHVYEIINLVKSISNE